MHTIRRGEFLRTLRPPGNGYVPAPISALQVGMEGHIVVQTSLEEHSHRKVQENVNLNSFIQKMCLLTFAFNAFPFYFIFLIF